jgi:Ca2+-binding RTX toxin-like protein
MRVDLTTMRIFGEGRDDLSGVEGIFSLNDGVDVFQGGPPPTLESVSGGAGENVLDLRTSDHGVKVATATTILAGPVSPRLYAHGFSLVLGSRFADAMIGGPGGFLSGPDEFRGRGGDDHLDGGDGNDRLLGGDGDDVIAGGEGVDTCRGGRGFDVVSACEHL